MVSQLMQDRTVVFAITHKSMLDTMALSLVLFDANKPLPLTFGGINMNTPGLGALARRAGVIFLRRTFQDNENIQVDVSSLCRLSDPQTLFAAVGPRGYALANGQTPAAAIRLVQLRRQLNSANAAARRRIRSRNGGLRSDHRGRGLRDRAAGRQEEPEGASWILKFLKRDKSHGRIHLRFWLSAGYSGVDVAGSVGRTAWPIWINRRSCRLSRSRSPCV